MNVLIVEDNKIQRLGICAILTGEYKFINCFAVENFTQAMEIFYLTSFPSYAPEASHETGCYDYLLKPYGKEELVQAVNRLLSRHDTRLKPKKEPLRSDGFNWARSWRSCRTNS